MEGIRQWRNKKNGFFVLEVHYSADPKKRSSQWKADEKQGIPLNDWNREYEIDFSTFVGKPVFEHDYDDRRMAKSLVLDPRYPLLRSWDFGYHHPAVAWGQVFQGVQCRILQSDMGEDIDFRLYVRKILHLTSQWFPGRKVLDCCDQAGRQVKPTDDPEIRILISEFGIVPRYRYFRVNYTIDLMRKLMNSTLRGEPCFLVNDVPSNDFLREALRGGYHYDNPAEGKRQKEEPYQDGYFENIVDPVRYMVANFMGMEGQHFDQMKKICMIDVPREKEMVI